MALTIQMELLRESRVVLRGMLAHHYMDGHPMGAEAETWLLRYGGWFADPQLCYDGFPPLDDGVDGPCFEVDEGILEAKIIIMINGAAT
jgi:hypothetical protein